MNRPIVFLSDFGLADTYVGQVKAVLAGIAPGSPVIDLTHDISAYAILEGAWALDSALAVIPDNAVVLAVVDPGVGGDRKEMVLGQGGRHFIGPDNGLLSAAFPASARMEAANTGSAIAIPAGVSATELCEPQFRRPIVSATFHGRDIFAPAAAWLSLGIEAQHMGPPLARAIAFPPFEALPVGFDVLEGQVIRVDRYGNIVTTIRAAQVFPTFSVHMHGHVIDRHVWTFSGAPPGVPFCHMDSSGYLAICVNQASAAELLGVSRGDAVQVHRE